MLGKITRNKDLINIPLTVRSFVLEHKLRLMKREGGTRLCPFSGTILAFPLSNFGKAMKPTSTGWLDGKLNEHPPECTTSLARITNTSKKRGLLLCRKIYRN